jgi:hypothetical protein
MYLTKPKPPTSSANTAARRVKNWKLNRDEKEDFKQSLEGGGQWIYTESFHLS